LGETTLRPEQKSLAWVAIQVETHRFPTLARLGEARSPEQDDLSPKTWALRFSEMLEQIQGRVSATFA